MNTLAALTLAYLNDVLVGLTVAVIVQRVASFRRRHAVTPLTTIDATLSSNGLAIGDALVGLTRSALSCAANIAFVYLIVAVVILAIASLLGRIARTPLLVRSAGLVPCRAARGLTSLGRSSCALTAHTALIGLTVAVVILPVALLDGRSACAERTVNTNLASLTAALCKTLLLLTGAALSGASVIRTRDKKARCDD